MKQNQRDKIIAAMDQAFIALHGKGLEESFETTHRLFSFLADGTERMRTRKQLASTLDSLPDLGVLEEKKFLVACRYAPHLLRFTLKSVAKRAVETLPKPPGGRRYLLSDAEEREVCKLIAGLTAHEVSVEDAVLRAAQQFAASERTIRRTWAARHVIAEEIRDPSFDAIMVEANRLLSDRN